MELRQWGYGGGGTGMSSRRVEFNQDIEYDRRIKTNENKKMHLV